MFPRLKLGAPCCFADLHEESAATKLRSHALAGEFLPVREPQSSSASHRERRANPAGAMGSGGAAGEDRTAGSPLSSRQNQLAGAKRPAPGQRTAVWLMESLLMALFITPASHRACTAQHAAAYELQRRAPSCSHVSCLYSLVS